MGADLITGRYEGTRSIHDLFLGKRARSRLSSRAMSVGDCFRPTGFPIELLLWAQAHNAEQQGSTKVYG